MKLLLFLAGIFFVQTASALFPSDSAKAKTDTAKISEFKSAILEVFRSYFEMKYWDIRTGARTAGNPWGYKNTYATRIKIPGEKYNMLYSFPSENSPMDFVSILKEADGFDKNFETAYRDYEKKLIKEFPASEGWVASCIVNTGAEKLPDVEIHKDNFGSVVLDFQRTPRGRYILFLRFLMY